jgi:ParB-like chromosome segregation protein Spo0J
VNINPALSRLAVNISELRNDPRNARIHDQRSIETIAVSLREFGQQKPLIALKDGTVIAGNGTLEAARALGWKKVAVVRFEDEAKARAFAIADNRTAELSTWDNGVLADVLGDLKDDIDLAAIGFNGFDIRRILGDFEPANNPDEEWKGMPDFEQGDETAARKLIVNFQSDEDAARFAELLTQHFGIEVGPKTKSVWWPKVEREDLVSKRYK